MARNTFAVSEEEAEQVDQIVALITSNIFASVLLNCGEGTGATSPPKFSQERRSPQSICGIRRKHHDSDDVTTSQIVQNLPDGTPPVHSLPEIYSSIVSCSNGISHTTPSCCPSVETDSAYKVPTHVKVLLDAVFDAADLVQIDPRILLSGRTWPSINILTFHTKSGRVFTLPGTTVFAAPCSMANYNNNDHECLVLLGRRNQQHLLDINKGVHPAASSTLATKAAAVQPLQPRLANASIPHSSTSSLPHDHFVNKAEFSGYHVNTPALIETTENDDVTSSSGFGVHTSSRLKWEGVPAAAAAGSAEGGASYSSTGSRGGTNSYLQAAARQTLTESQQLSRWLLDEGSVFQPLNSNDALEEEAERALFSTSGTAHRALLQASADIGTTWTGDWRGASSSISGGNNTASNRSRQLTMMVGGGIAAELAQLQRALGVLFGTQVLPTTPNIQTSIESNNVNILNTSSLPLGSSTVSQGAQGHSEIGRSTGRHTRSSSAEAFPAGRWHNQQAAGWIIRDKLVTTNEGFHYPANTSVLGSHPAAALSSHKAVPQHSTANPVSLAGRSAEVSVLLPFMRDNNNSNRTVFPSMSSRPPLVPPRPPPDGNALVDNPSTHCWPPMDPKTHNDCSSATNAFQPPSGPAATLMKGNAHRPPVSKQRVSSTGGTAILSTTAGLGSTASTCTSDLGNNEKQGPISKAWSEPDLASQTRGGDALVSASTRDSRTGAPPTAGWASDLVSRDNVLSHEQYQFGFTHSRDMEEMRSHIRRLVELRQRQREAQERSRLAQEAVQKLLSQRKANHVKEDAMRCQQDGVRRYSHVAESCQQLLLESRSRLQAKRNALVWKATALHASAGVLQSADQRMRDAEIWLKGPDGQGRWQHVLHDLVGRRNWMVAELASIYKVGPTNTAVRPHVLEGGYTTALERQIDKCWMAGAVGDDDEEDIAEEDEETVGSGGWSHDRVLTTAPRAPPLQHQAKQHHPQGAGSYRDTSNSTQTSGGLLCNKKATVNPNNKHYNGLISGPPAKLSIVGLEIPPQLVRLILHGEDGLGGPGSPDEEARMAAALGYMAHMVERLAFYLDVPLRYPLLPRLSKSLLRDEFPVIFPDALPVNGIFLKGLTSLASVLTQPWWRDGATSSISSAINYSGGVSHMSPKPNGVTGAGVSSAAAPPEPLMSGTEGSIWSEAARLSSLDQRPPQQRKYLIEGQKVNYQKQYNAREGQYSGNNRAYLQPDEQHCSPRPLQVLDLPLFSDSSLWGVDRSRYALAVHLLSKDIEQILQILGISPVGPNQVLHNLYILVTAAQTAVNLQHC
ncbi:hypothetical protein CEUSTIGMA_g12312.t1 [Chlamydomonas eustigma]|uniref:Uncharacterized protein n=1 Tax=Chlamydomonas eustigma TaxID=1157962 RepID=A0A250XP90_9CHLO|nr:hypothetical protein CEUSTIGMA_g12312.t1 [Chlamydomonas eustigma]|eukprot:GAX84891.1 hypothetical protein CEUSTIGMA_g12312.t1 [Chlamydomonas eustigma]